MNFKTWLLTEEQLYNEDFKTQREKFIQQGVDSDTVDKYLTDFRNIKEKKYKQINDPIHGLENIKDRTNIDNYKTFHELSTLVDYVKGQVDVTGKTSYKNIKVDAKPIYEDNNIIIYYADSPQACVTYKGSVPYSWCIAKSDVGNLFYYHRLKKYEPAFYFVKNKKRTNQELKTFDGKNFKDIYHFFIIQVLKDADLKDKNEKQYIVTSAQNDGDKPMSWNDIVKIEPLLKNKQKIFAANPLEAKERELYEKFKHGISDEEFSKLPYDKKDMYLSVYVRQDRILNDNKFKDLPNELKNKYINFRYGLSNEQVKMLDPKLYKRYEEITIDKINDKVGTGDLKLTLAEEDIFRNYVMNHEFDFDKLHWRDIKYLLWHAKEEELNKIIPTILNKKSKISHDDLFIILQYSKNINKEDIINKITHKTPEIQRVINKYLQSTNHSDNTS